MAKILVADDESSLRFLVTETLLMDGEHELLEAKDGEEAWQIIEEYRPDIVFLDIMMPKISGYEIASKLQSVEHKPKIIMLTAMAQTEDIQKGFLLNVDYYLTKPFSPMDLFEIIDKVLGVKVLK